MNSTDLLHRYHPLVFLFGLQRHEGSMRELSVPDNAATGLDSQPGEWNSGKS